MKKVVIVFIAFFAVYGIVPAEINFNGYVQNWFSVSTNNMDLDEGMIYGFSNKRIRFKTYGNLGDKFEWGVYFSFDKFSPDILEAYLKYSLSDSINLRVGKWSAPGAASGSLMSSNTLDFIERAPITKLWGYRSALDGYRTEGIEISGKFLDDKIFYSLMIANAVSSDNSWIPSIKKHSTFNDHNGMAFWGRLEAFPIKGLRIGGFYGSGTETDSNGNSLKRGSSGAHIYFKRSNFNLKVEYISGEITGLKYNGMYVSAGFRIKKTETLLRYDNYTPIEGGEKFTDYSLGVNFFPANNIRIQANYIFRKESISTILNNIFYINFQFGFSSK